jgi:hypothetical protein
MRLFKNLLALTVISALIAADAHAYRILDDAFVLGKPGSSSNQTMKLGTTGTIQYNNSTSKLQFAHDGTNFKDIGSGAGASGGINLLGNPDFESGLVNWTSSGGAFTVVTSGSNLLNGSKSALWVPSSANQTLTSDQVTVPAGLTGGGCMGKAFYKTTEATNLYTLVAIDGSSNVLGSATIYPTVGSSAGTVPVYFPCPTTGTIALKVLAAGTVPGAGIALDDLHIGSITSGGQISQTTRVGAAYFATTASCVWTHSGTSLGAFNTTAACPGPTVEVNAGPGVIQTTDVDLPQVTVNNMPAGEYIVTVSAYMTQSTTSDATLAVSDGTTTSGNISFNTTGTTAAPVVAIGHFSYSSAGNRTFQLFGSASTGTVSVLNSNSQAQTRITIIRYPSASETAYRTDSVAASWSGTVNGTWGGVTSSYSDFNSGTGIVMSQRNNTNFGTVSASSGSTLGVTFTPSRIGSYWVCASVTAYVSAPATAYLRLVDGAGNVVNGGLGNNYSAANSAAPFQLCGQLSAPTLSPVTVKVQSLVLSGATVTVANLTDWGIFQMYAAQGAPVFPGNVTSVSTGQLRHEYAVINTVTSGSLTVDSQSGFLTVGACDANANCSVTFSGFSGTPACVGSDYASNAGILKFGTVTSGGATISSRNSTTGATLTGKFSLLCTGPR